MDPPRSPSVMKPMFPTNTGTASDAKSRGAASSLHSYSAIGSLRAERGSLAAKFL